MRPFEDWMKENIIHLPEREQWSFLKKLQYFLLCEAKREFVEEMRLAGESDEFAEFEWGVRGANNTHLFMGYLVALKRKLDVEKKLEELTIRRSRK